ncbi:21194_t:CDS:2 [Rhizophagus irregularis]|nr:21194_t:CDS:2 [Rhizophagus irregularis]
MEQMAKEAVSEDDSVYEVETSHLTIEKSENDPDYEAKDSHVLLQDITTLSANISNIEYLEISKQSKQQKASTKIRRPKISWVWQFFEFNKNNTKAVSTHLSDAHGITKEIAMKHDEEELKNPPESSIKPYKHSKQESLTQNIIGFVIGIEITLKNQLVQVKYISLTLDAWSLPAHLSYLDVTAHWITSDFEPNEVLLSMKELPYPHGATEIQEHLIN